MMRTDGFSAILLSLCVVFRCVFAPLLATRVDVCCRGDPSLLVGWLLLAPKMRGATSMRGVEKNGLRLP